MSRCLTSAPPGYYPSALALLLCAISRSAFCAHVGASLRHDSDLRILGETVLWETVHGSPGLIQTLLEHDLIDEYRLWIFPVAIGTGKRFFGEGTIPAAFRLVDTKVSKTGVTINTYVRAGDIDPGSFEFDEPTEAELERRKSLVDA